jgi:hypothetical protein
LLNGDNSNVAAIGSDQADFRNADALIHSKFCSADMLLLYQNS